tara:strand:- start:12233 stop:13375 length:1143 start_codon:yes stop_codon:yes gene_type:complete
MLISHTSASHLLGLFAACLIVLWGGKVAAASTGQAVVTKPGEVALEVGQALITHQAGRCLAILPTHVVAEAVAPALRYAVTQRAILGAIEGINELGDDLSFGQIRGEIERNCGHGIGGFSRAVNTRLTQSNQGSLRFVNGDGSFGYFPVTWIDDDRELYVRVVPGMANQSIRRGMSGSLLMSADQVPIGMLLNVSTRSGVGTVMRIDRLLERVERFKAGEPIKNALQQEHKTTPVPDVRPRADATFEVLSWSAPPAGPTHGPEHLTAQNDTNDFWLAEADHPRVTLELELPAVELTSSITLDVNGLQSDWRPASAEVLVSSGGAGRFRSVWGGALPFNPDARQTIHFGESQVKALTIILYPQKSPTGHYPVGLRAIEIGQ